MPDLATEKRFLDLLLCILNVDSPFSNVVQQFLIVSYLGEAAIVVDVQTPIKDGGE